MIERYIVSPEDLLASIGIHIRDFIAGFMGGVSIVFGDRRPDPWDIIAMIVAGALAANYLAPWISEKFGAPELLTAYFIGTAGRSVCRVVARFVASKIRRTLG